MLLFEAQNTLTEETLEIEVSELALLQLVELLLTRAESVGHPLDDIVEEALVLRRVPLGRLISSTIVMMPGMLGLSVSSGRSRRTMRREHPCRLVAATTGTGTDEVGSKLLESCVELARYVIPEARLILLLLRVTHDVA